MQIGDNIEASVEKNVLTLKIDLTKSFGRSASGKTTIVASSRGNAYVAEAGCTVGLNIYKK